MVILESNDQLSEFVKTHQANLDAYLAMQLAQALTYFKVIEIASKGGFAANPDPLRRYGYPNSLDKLVKIDLDRINLRCKLLKEYPDQLHPEMEPITELP